MNHPKGDGWVVREFNHYTYRRKELGIFSTQDDVHGNVAACELCVRQAMAGNPDAIVAILLCPEDLELQALLK